MISALTYRTFVFPVARRNLRDSQCSKSYGRLIICSPDILNELLLHNRFEVEGTVRSQDEDIITHAMPSPGRSTYITGYASYMRYSFSLGNSAEMSNLTLLNE